MTEKIKIVFLGTSDSVPSASRNHPSMWLNYKGENILFDCGEGTQRQIRKAKLNPCKITKILITHWHADHVLGLPGLLKTLEMSGYRKTLHIYGPKGTKLLMKSLLKLFAFRTDYQIKIEEVNGKFFENEDFYLESEKMDHRVPCNAYNFVKKGKLRIDKIKHSQFKITSGKHLQKLKQGKAISYKGKKYSAKTLTYSEGEKKVSFVLDTAFNKKISPFVKEADVFICESAFSSEIKEKAEERYHMTAKKAGEAAKKAKVKKLFLIHISQRYSKNLEQILKEAKKIFKNSYLPKDLDSLEI